MKKTNLIFGIVFFVLLMTSVAATTRPSFFDSPPAFFLQLDSEYNWTDRTGNYTTKKDGTVDCLSSSCDFGADGVIIVQDFNPSQQNNLVCVGWGIQDDTATNHYLWSGYATTGISATNIGSYYSTDVAIRHRMYRTGFTHLDFVATTNVYQLMSWSYDGSDFDAWVNDSSITTNIAGTINTGIVNLSVGASDHANYWDNNISMVFCTYDNISLFNQTVVDYLYSQGRENATYDILFGEPAVGEFELTVRNSFNQSSINNFTASITNTTDTVTIITTNGTIFYPQSSEDINISITNISLNTYFNRSFTNVSTSSNLEVEAWQSVIIIEARDSITNEILENFNITLDDGTYSQFNTSNSSNLTTFLVNVGTFTANGKAQNYVENATDTFTSTLLQTSSETLYFTPNIFNITAIDNFTNEPILIFNASVNGFFYNTTNGTIQAFATAALLDINVTAENFLNLSVSEHNTSNNLSSEMQSLISHFVFVDTGTNESLFNSTVTVTYPSGQELELTTNSTGGINFSVVFNQYPDFGNFTLGFEDKQGYVTPITITEEINSSNTPLRRTYNISQANMIVRIFDRETGNLLDGIEAEIILQEYLNVTTTNGTYFIRNVSIVSGELIMQALSSGYGTEQKVFEYTNQENVTLDFYLLNLTGANTGTVFVNVIDEFFRIIEGATVSLLEYNTENKSFIEVSQCLTNVNGECPFFIELNTKTYVIRASKIIEGVAYLAISNPEIIQTDGETRNFFLRAITQNILTNIDGVDINATEQYLTTWDEVNKSQITVYFISDDGSSRTVCLEYLKDDSQESISCNTGSSGFIIGSEIDLNRSSNYEAKVYILDGSRQIPYFSKIYPSDNSAESLLKVENFAKFFFFFLWLASIIAGFLAKNIPFISILGVILPWVELAIFPSLGMLTGSVIKTIISCTIYIVARRKQDTQ